MRIQLKEFETFIERSKATTNEEITVRIYGNDLDLLNSKDEIISSIDLKTGLKNYYNTPRINCELYNRLPDDLKNKIDSVINQLGFIHNIKLYYNKNSFLKDASIWILFEEGVKYSGLSLQDLRDRNIEI